MKRLDLSTAKDKILADIRRYVAEVQCIAGSPVETVEDGIRTLIALRKTSYEDLNQIQHEYAAFCAVHWLIAERRAPEGVTWQWNPRQTGDAAEPDIRAVLEGQIIISGEVTTSPDPKGFVDSPHGLHAEKARRDGGAAILLRAHGSDGKPRAH